MSKKIDLTGQRFGNRLIVRNECVNDDWLNIGKTVPSNASDYSLGKCLNCGAIIPTDRTNLYRQPPKRCSFCSNIGNHYKLETNTNSWVVKDDVAICNIIYQKKVISFYIDKDFYDTASKYIWRISQKKNKYYVVSGSSKKGTMLYIHQLVLGNSSYGKEIDHVDGNSLNNKLSNLRFVNHQENVDNIKATRIDNRIGIRGISYDKRSKKYTVDFNYHNNRYYLKPWDTIEEAVYCRKYIEERFGLHLVANNPMYEYYKLNDEKAKREIEEYVSSKIS